MKKLFLSFIFLINFWVCFFSHSAQCMEFQPFEDPDTSRITTIPLNGTVPYQPGPYYEEEWLRKKKHQKKFKILVSDSDLNSSPYNAVGLLRIKSNDGKFHSTTGVQIRPGFVLTVAHSIFHLGGTKENKVHTVATSITFYPQMNISPGVAIDAKEVTLYEGNMESLNQDLRKDIAVIKLIDDSYIPTWSLPSADQIENLPVEIRVTGYPFDDPFYGAHLVCQENKRKKGQSKNGLIEYKKRSSKLSKPLDILKVQWALIRNKRIYVGQSGGPVFFLDDDRFILIAVHSYSVAELAKVGIGVLLDNEYLLTIEEWIRLMSVE